MLSIGARNLFFPKSLGKFRSFAVPNPELPGSGLPGMTSLEVFHVLRQVRHFDRERLLKGTYG